MVYCSKCGAKNKDEAKICVKCGESLYLPRERRERHVEECFGIPRGSAIFGILIGAIIIIIGILYFLSKIFGWIIEFTDIFGVLILFAIGIMFFAGGFYRLRRER
ncbi:MAG: zinc-ribbon domain-containing protein [Candidatus Hadarchaeaceae archaeon]|nr:zinc ribbon domain-containing protein [Hadesarchaea archaeon]